METLEKLRFDQFLVKEGKLIGKVGEREIELDQILSNGKGQTFVTFYEDGEKKEVLHSDRKGYRNSRVYG